MEEIGVERAVFKDDEKCFTCNQDFGLFKMRHHCRRCGNSFCFDHADKWVSIKEMGYLEPVRVCDQCYVDHIGFDLSVPYDAYGDQHGETVVVLHGALGNRYHMKHVCELLSARYRVLNVDLPGHGSRVNIPMTVDSTMEILMEDILSQSRGRKVAVFGYSLGGYVAMCLASVYPQFISCAIYGGCAHDGSELLRGAGLVYAVLSNEAKSGLVKMSFDVPLEDLETIHKSGMTYDSWDGCLSFLVEPIKDWYSELISGYPGNMLLIHGSKDFRDAEEKFLNVAEGRMELIVIENATHIHCCISPGYRDEMTEQVLNFIYEKADWGMII